MTAAIAPSDDTIGATIPTLPILNPEYAKRRPMLLPKPATKSKPSASPSRFGTPSTAAQGTVIARPVSITHARTDGAPISRVARVAQRVAAAHASAAPSPPRTATIGLGGYRATRTREELGRQDSNLGSRDQNPLPYRLATPQS